VADTLYLLIITNKGDKGKEKEEEGKGRKHTEMKGEETERNHIATHLLLRATLCGVFNHCQSRRCHKLYSAISPSIL